MSDLEITMQPSVSRWRLLSLRFVYFLIFAGISSFVWQQLLFESSQWPVMTGVAKAMMAAMALLCLLGIRYPLQFLPLLLWETLWKTIWIVVIAIPSWNTAQWIALESAFYQSIGIIVVYFIVPWPYVWWRYIAPPPK